MELDLKLKYNTSDSAELNRSITSSIKQSNIKNQKIDFSKISPIKTIKSKNTKGNIEFPPLNPQSKNNTLHKNNNSVDLDSLVSNKNMTAMPSKPRINMRPSGNNASINTNISNQKYSLTNSNDNNNIQLLVAEKDVVLGENLKLKTLVSKLKNEVAYYKAELMKVENEPKSREKNSEDYLIATNENVKLNTSVNTPSNNNTSNIIFNHISTSPDTKVKGNHLELIASLKKQNKEILKENRFKDEEVDRLRKQIRLNKIKELNGDTKALADELDRIKILYDNAMAQLSSTDPSNLDKLMKEILLLQEYNSKQQKHILALQENTIKLQEENKMKEEEIKIVKNNLLDYANTMKKLKSELKYQSLMQEKMSKNDEVQNNAHREAEKKLIDLTKDYLFYKDMNDKKELIIKELEEKRENIKKDLEEKLAFLTSKDKDRDSILQQYKKDKEKISELSNKNEQLESEIKKQKQEEIKMQKNLEKLEKIVNKNITLQFHKQSGEIFFSATKPNLVMNKDEAELLKEDQFNEMSYILIKNFEGAKVHPKMLIDKVFNTFSEGTHICILFEKIPNIILSLLNNNNVLNLKEITLWLKTFYFSVNDFNKFKTHFSNVFDSVSIYSDETMRALTEKLKVKLQNAKDVLFSEIKKYDTSNSGYVTFSIMRNLFSELNFKMESELMEFYTFLLKNFSDPNSYIHELKYENIFSLFSEERVESQEEINSSVNSKSQITIPAEDFLKRTEAIFIKIAKFLYENSTNVKNYFVDTMIIKDKENTYNGIYLKVFLKILNSMNIILDNLDAVCIFNRLKSPNNIYNFEIIDLQKLTDEISAFGIYELGASLEKSVEENNEKQSNEKKNEFIDIKDDEIIEIEEIKENSKKQGLDSILHNKINSFRKHNHKPLDFIHKELIELGLGLLERKEVQIKIATKDIVNSIFSISKESKIIFYYIKSICI